MSPAVHGDYRTACLRKDFYIRRKIPVSAPISQGIFTKPFNTEFVNAWRKGLISYAESVCTGKPMTHEECLNNIQSLFDDIIATSK